MSQTYLCPDCESEMALAEGIEKCQSDKCAKELTVEEAQKLFDNGEIVKVVDEADLDESENADEIIIANLDEDISALVGNENLSEEFTEKAKTIMESAIAAKTKIAVAKIEEEYSTKLDEEKKSLVKKIDGYLDYVVAEWLKENEIAIETGLKVKMNEEFVEGLSSLFEQHFIKVPEDRWDVVEGLASKVEELEAKLDEEIETAISIKKEVFEKDKELSIIKLSEGLSDTQKEKLIELSESVTASSIEDFESKIETLKEGYFSVKQPVSESDTNEDAPVITEDTGADSEDIPMLRALRKRV